MRFSGIVAVILSAAWPGAPFASAQGAFEYWPGARYDSEIPAMETVLNHGPGERIVPHLGIIRYMEALAKAAPDRMRVYEYARSWENRELIYAVIGSAENIARLDAIKSGMHAIADPRVTSAAEADRLIGSLPSSVFLAYGVHGNEISSPDAALFTAYHLLAARDDAVVEKILANTLVFIDPTQNPDGRDRFVHNFEIAEGLEADASPLAAEHNEPWPGGRTNHYYFDMNRDWFALTQPESRGRVKTLLEWYPSIYVDLHEMGGNSTYYFPPEAVPYNPHFTTTQRENLEILGRNNAKWFDTFGFSYFTREVYDAFYPGYGSGWPIFYGGLGTTYEQASARGLVLLRSDGDLLHFRESVRHHFVASMSTAEMAADNREKLLRDFWDYRRTAIEEGETEEVRAYILPRTDDASLTDKLAALLVEQGIEVQRATAPFTACGKKYDTGAYVISLAQPAKRLIRTLIDRDVSMEPDFLIEQERRRAKKLADEIYDVTAWSLPMMYNVTCTPCGRKVRGAFEAATAEPIRAGRLHEGAGEVAYLVPWGSVGAGRLLTAALREGLDVWSSDKAFTQSAREFPRGTLIFKTKENADTLRAALEKLAAQSGVDVYPTDSGWVDAGVNFGSRNVVKIRPPRVAIAWDSPTASYSAGQTRFILERQFGYPVTAIRTRQLASAELGRFQVLILPAGTGYQGVLKSAGATRLKEWVKAGGVLIALGSATSYVADPEVGLLEIREEYAIRTEEDKKSSETEKEKDERRVKGTVLKSEEDYRDSIEAKKESPDNVQGIMAEARTDPDHWLTAGLAKSLNVLVRGSKIYSPIALDKGVNVARFAGAEDLLRSGYIWEENRKQLAYKPFIVQQKTGRGMVIAFTQDPTVRAYLDGLNVALLNAVFRAPAHANPVARD